MGGCWPSGDPLGNSDCTVPKFAIATPLHGDEWAPGKQDPNAERFPELDFPGPQFRHPDGWEIDCAKCSGEA